MGATEELFTKLGERGYEPRLAKVDGTVRFDLVDGKTTRRWLVELEKGNVTVSRRNARADAVVSADRKLFERIASGEANALAAILRDEVRVSGDVRLLVAFQRLLPGPPSARQRRES